MEIAATTHPSESDRSCSSDLSLLAELRVATKVSHQQIEHNVRLRRIFQPGYTLSEYRSLLARLLGFYAPLEADLATLPVAVHGPFHLSKRWKTPWLRQDLERLGLDTDAISALPHISVRARPRITAPSAAVGCLYVLEGATLGGQLISRQLANTLNLNAECGGRFYSGYGTAAGSMWSEFRATLEALTFSDADIALATHTAVEMFTCLDRWLAHEDR